MLFTIESTSFISRGGTHLSWLILCASCVTSLKLFDSWNRSATSLAKELFLVPESFQMG